MFAEGFINIHPGEGTRRNRASLGLLLNPSAPAHLKGLNRNTVVEPTEGQEDSQRSFLDLTSSHETTVNRESEDLLSIYLLAPTEPSAWLAEEA